MKLVIGDIPPSSNKYLGNSHSFHVYRQDKERWHWLVKAAIRERPERPIGRAAVAVTYFFKDRRRRDPDNYSGKFILDALVREGVLADDSFFNVRLILAAAVDRAQPRTEIEIDEIRMEGEICR